MLLLCVIKCVLSSHCQRWTLSKFGVTVQCSLCTSCSQVTWIRCTYRDCYIIKLIRLCNISFLIEIVWDFQSPNCPSTELIMAMFFIPLSFLSRSFIFSRVFHFQSGVAFIQEIISPLFQAHCRRPVTQLYNFIRNSRGIKKQKLRLFQSLFSFFVCALLLLWISVCTSVRGRVWRKKKIGVRWH